ncbi:MAG: penicillin acylase family protein [Bryobacteraceae bacterium]
MTHRIAVLLLGVTACFADRVPGLREPVEILRDKWGVPHIYAKNADDLFFAQGWIAAKDRLYQLDTWRRQGTGKLSEVLGPKMIQRDRFARLVRYRGDWDAEWKSYSADAKPIATAFTKGINAYIRSLKGKRPVEFETAGYDPGLWEPEDVVARIAGLVMTRNLTTELTRAVEVSRFGAATIEKVNPPDPFIKLQAPRGLDLAKINPEVLREYQAVTSGLRSGDSDCDPLDCTGSNNWVVDGSMTASGKPLLANDPHRPINIPSLRKTVHLVAPGWNVIGAGEPALPGVALGHNESVGFGFTIAQIDQQDLFVEKINPANANQYLIRGAWKNFETEKQTIKVKGAADVTVDLHYSIHGPVIFEDKTRNLAYAIKWVGAEPGGAGYLAALSLARTKNWKEFLAGVEHYKVPSENLVYADTQGNIGWIAAGLAPIRKSGSGLFPVPGDTGEYEWQGFMPVADHPQIYNPAKHFVDTANNNILPPGYTKQFSYEWALPFRANRVAQVLSSSKSKFTVADFERLQQDVYSAPAKRFQQVVAKWRAKRDASSALLVDEFLRWDCRITADSRPALLYELWIAYLTASLYPPQVYGHTPNLEIVLKGLEQTADSGAIGDALSMTIRDLERRMPHKETWKWGALHQLSLRHVLGEKFSLDPVARPGDANTVNAAGGAGFKQSSGASYRQVLDFADWDRSMMTNVPGESGDPSSKHYSDLLKDWATGTYHPMPFSRKAVEAATDERIVLEP